MDELYYLKEEAKINATLNGSNPYIATLPPFVQDMIKASATVELGEIKAEKAESVLNNTLKQAALLNTTEANQ